MQATYLYAHTSSSYTLRPTPLALQIRILLPDTGMILYMYSCVQYIKGCERALFYKGTLVCYNCKTVFTEKRSHRLTVRTDPFHGSNRGSIPRGITITKQPGSSWLFCYVAQESKLLCFRRGIEKRSYIE